MNFFRVRQRKGKGRRLQSVAILFGVLILIIVGTTILLARMDEPDTFDGTLTTTIDLKRKTIKADGVADDELDPRATWQASIWNVYKLSGMHAAALQLYETVTNPGTKVIVVHPGMRKEEVAELFAKKLNWDSNMKAEFTQLSPDIEQKIEGYLYPDTYLVPKGTTPVAAHEAVVDRFNAEVQAKYPASTASAVSVDLALKVASLIQREAAGKEDMAIISGIIWNRLFKDEALGIDATLQYAKGNEKIGWWPRLTSRDKFIDSPYNTYKNGGLPPTPISSPSLAAINAALNPKKTTAMFYIHDKQRRIHTAVTYKQHKANIAKYY